MKNSLLNSLFLKWLGKATKFSNVKIKTSLSFVGKFNSPLYKIIFTVWVVFKNTKKCPYWLRQSKQNQPSGQTNMWLWSLTQSMYPIQPLQFLAQPDFSRFNCCPFDSVLNIISFQVSTVTLILFWSIITLIFFWSPSLH